MKRFYEYAILTAIVVFVGSYLVDMVGDATARIAEDTAIKMRELH